MADLYDRFEKLAASETEYRIDERLGRASRRRGVEGESVTILLQRPARIDKVMVDFYFAVKFEHRLCAGQHLIGSVDQCLCRGVDKRQLAADQCADTELGETVDPA